MLRTRLSAIICAITLCAGTTWGVEEEETPKPTPLPSGVSVQRDIEYVPGGGKSRSLDIYLPSSEHAVPLVMFIHGGGWLMGSKDGCPAQFLAAHGYAVASINYRLSQEAIFPAQIEDCRIALRFLRSQANKYHIQPDHVGVWGGSAGGHLASLMGIAVAVDFRTMPATVAELGKEDESTRVQCVIDMYGAVDFPTLSVSKSLEKIKTVTQLLGSYASEDELLTKARWASPISYVRSGSPPFLIQHGDADKVVTVKQSHELYEVLKAAGADVTLNIMPGAGHAGTAFFTEENHQALIKFLDRCLKQGK